MAETRERYRKLPGRRRGFLFGSSVWLGKDHLLLVKSARFREEYRRFYFRDIQAIVTAEAPRFHLSTRSAAIGALWSLAFLFLWTGFRQYAWIGWAAISAMAALWVYVSMYRSCRCRLYTAVSAEELPSVYRTWVARRFLDQVQPQIEAVQGSIVGDWSEAVEERQVGALPEGRIGIGKPAAVGEKRPAEAHTPVALLFVGVCVAAGLAKLATVGAAARAARWVLLTFVLLEVAAAAAVLVEYQRARLGRAMRNLAIAALAAIGLWYYAVQVGGGIALAYRAGQSNNPRSVPQMEPMGLLLQPWSRGAAGGVSLLLGLVGVALVARGERGR